MGFDAHETELVMAEPVVAIRNTGLELSQDITGQAHSGHPFPAGFGGLIRVLVVENNLAVREPVTESLRQAGFEVVDVADGPDALSHSGQRFDILFTDIDLPGGLDGWAVAERWRERDRDIGVIYTSGFCLRPGRAVVGSRCLPKPYRPGRVATIVEMVNERP